MEDSHSSTLSTAARRKAPVITVNDKWQLEHRPGMTIRDVLTALGFTHPVVVVSVNGAFIPPAEYTTQTFSDGDSVVIIHIIGGG